MNNQTSDFEQLNQIDLARFVVNAFRLSMLHYGLWFNEVQHQLGLEEAIQTEREVADTMFPLALKRLSKSTGFKTADGVPAVLTAMPKEKLLNLIDVMAANWLADDGLWFQAVEKRQEMYTAKRCNDTCWTRFSPLEAHMIKALLSISDQEGLTGLEKALNFRLYARLNEQASERKGDSLIFKMLTCRVQQARKSKGLEDYPCKSAGLVEYSTFAKAVDSRIKTECLSCPPDEHPEEWSCAWRFYIG